MQIPVVINNRNRLSTAKQLINDLIRLGYNHLYILDNQSTYEPLLQWYMSCPAEVIMLGNMGHQALWLSGIISKFGDHEFICYTDSDIQLHPDTQPGFIEQLVMIAKDFRTEKAGLAIEYTDVPNQNLLNIIGPIESRYWKHRLHHPTHEIYDAILDTTFQVIRTSCPYGWHYSSVRVAGTGFTCKHMPWYNTQPLSVEEQYVLQHSDERYSSYKSHIPYL